MEPRTASIAAPLLRRLRLSPRASLDQIPRPTGTPSAHSSGPDPYKFLICGTDSANGWGVRSHDIALPGYFARAITALTGCGSTVDLEADSSGVGIDAVAHLLARRTLTRYDAVVVVTGVFDAVHFMAEPVWEEHVIALLDDLHLRTRPGAPIVIGGIPPPSNWPTLTARSGGVSDRWAERLNSLTAHWCEKSARAHFFPVQALQGSSLHTGHVRAAEHYQEAGEALAAHLASRLPTRASGYHPEWDGSQDTETRVTAIRALLANTSAQERFDAIVRRARQLFGTEAAAFTLVGDDHQWFKSVSGIDMRQTPLSESFCATTITTTQPLVVTDTHTDTRGPRDSPFRFYAGYPIETPEGVRIGALCVFDTRPKIVSENKLRLLRDLALTIQNEIAPNNTTTPTEQH